MTRGTIAVTGASGYIGSVLVDELAARSSKILRVSRHELAPRDGTESLKGDISTLECWRNIVDAADVIFHLAGNTSVYAAAEDPAASLASTVLPVNLLIQAAQQLGRKPRVVHASTATVYGLTGSSPADEALDARPITVYDLHKLFAERQLALASEQRLLESVSLRLANVYGPSSSVSSAADRGVLNKITAMAMEGKALTVYGSGEYLRDYVYIDDVVRAFMLAGASDTVSEAVLNVATGRSVSLEQAFRLVAEGARQATGRSVDIGHAPWPANASPIECRNYVADIKRITSAYGWAPEVCLEDGIRQLIRSHVEHGGPSANRAAHHLHGAPGTAQ